jgi:hypothetical protein
MSLTLISHITIKKPVIATSSVPEHNFSVATTLPLDALLNLHLCLAFVGETKD